MYGLLNKFITKLKSSLFNFFALILLLSVTSWGAADLSITKTVNNSNPNVGDNVTFTIVGRNSGPDTSDIVITDTLPTGLTWISDTDNGTSNFNCTNVGNAVTCTGTRDFATGNNVTINIVARVDSSGSKTNTATIASANGIADNNNTNNSASVTLVPNPADLSVTKTVNNSTPNVGDTVTFTIIGRNNGPTTSDIRIVDDLSSSLQWIFDDDNGKNNFDCTNVLNLVTCTGTEDFSPNETVTINISARVLSQGAITNTVNIASTNSIFDNNTSNNTASVTLNVPAPNADLSITKTASPATPSIGNNVTYTITGRNNGPVSSRMTITDTLPLGLEWVSDNDNSANFDCTNVLNAVTCTGTRDFLSGETAVVTLVARVASEGNITNTATISSANSIQDNNTLNNSASAVIDGQPNYGIDNVRAFTLFRQNNINGDMQIIGNSVKLNTGGVCPPNGTDNNDLTTVYADRDSDATTFNSTSANLVLPPKVKGSNIEYAMLYWQGRTNNNNDVANGKSVKIRPYGSLSYTTVSSINAKFNWKTSNYQGAADVTNLIKASVDAVPTATLDSTGYNQALWVADVYAPINSNGFGAWSLVIVYQDSAAKLRNISTYDGYEEVMNNTKSATLSGFLTPTNGIVDSKFLIFAGEGDITLTDSVTMSNNVGTDVSLGNNIFRSSEDIAGVNVTNRNPSCQNTIGIDIRTFNVGTSGSPVIIGNQQTSTTVKLTSTGDRYYPGVFAFSTELYTPDVCYIEDLKFNGSTISGSNLPQTGDKVDYNVTITNKNNEPAKGVLIEKKFDRPSEIKYHPQSIQIAPIPGTTFASKTDSTTNDDTAEFNTDTNISKFFLGSGATGGTGGTIGKDEITRFTYKAEVGDQNASENIYFVSYRNDVLNVNFTGLPIRKCTDFNNSFGIYTPVIGKFNTVRSGAVNVNSETDPTDPVDAKNALYTQIVNQSFNVDVLALGADNITPTAPTIATDLNLSIVELTADGNCTANNLSTVQTLLFSVSDKFKPATILPLQASQNAAFRMVTSNADLCSRDRFAIRPFSYKIDANETGLIGKKWYQFAFVANQYNAPSTPSSNYNQTIDNASGRTATTQLSAPIGCGLATPVEAVSNSIPFGNGQASALVLYNNVGSIDFKITDSHWTIASEDQAKGDCLTNNFSNVPDANGKIGCNIEGSQQFTFLPKAFQNSFQVQDFANNFTYISSDGNMSAQSLLTTTALLDDNTIATNYTAGCFARNINYTISLINNPVTWLNGTPNSINRILYFEDGTTSNFENNNTIGSSEFSSTEGNFTNGIASNLTVRFNFTRSNTKADFPFNIAKNDFNISVQDTNGTLGNDFDRTMDQNTTFYYGRAHAPDYRFAGNSGTAVMYYEVYAKDLNLSQRQAFGITGNQGVDSVNWYQNALHVTTAGTTNPSSPTITIGAQTNAATSSVVLTHTPPHVGKVNLGSSSWLVYYPTDFTVEFYSSGSWAGAGFVKEGQPNATDTNTTVGEHIHKAAPIKANRRITW